MDFLVRLRITELGDVRHHRLLVDSRIVHLLSSQDRLDVKVLLCQVETLVGVVQLVCRIKIAVIGAETRLNGIIEGAQGLAIVPVLLEVLDIVLRNLATNPLQKIVLSRGQISIRVALVDLVSEDESPDQTQLKLCATTTREREDG